MKEDKPQGFDDIGNNLKNLEQKMVLFNTQKEEYIKEKVSQREVFISELKTLKGLFTSAQKVLDFYQKINELGRANNEEVQKFEEAKNLVAEIEKQQSEISLQMEKIHDIPEVIDVIQDMIKEEDKEKNLQKDKEIETKKIDTQLDDLAEKIKSLALHTEELNKEYKKDCNDKTGYLNKIQVIFMEGFDKEKLKNDAQHFYDTKFINSEAAAENFIQIIDDLEKIKEGIGVFEKKKKEKNLVLDFILLEKKEELDKLFDQWKKLKEKSEEEKKQINDIPKKEQELANQYNYISDELDSFMSKYDISDSDNLEGKLSPKIPIAILDGKADALMLKIRSLAEKED